MDREQALSLIKQYVKNKNLVKHMLATEVVLRKLAKVLGEDQEKWGLAGLLHDIDYDLTYNEPHKHSIIGGEILEKYGVDPEIVYAVKAHNEIHGFQRKSNLDKALYSADPLTGLIVASALIHPEKKLNSIDAQFVLNRFSEKHFAKGANREQIASCSDFGLSLEEFIEIGLSGMQEQHEELGL
ncbi:HDIG domain-containing protein [Anaerobranca californiensis DSM 14826]|jgi:putative nucleotidyltransferase with HDIG domain|uniref:HDIG domain-containing protein n=1 Tax=Anaerobranca californiensis DSM 14826 TaxID=1120989 RepID=A0A1M6QPF7_9FIRM|nr:HDIG domain-containing metalloprotein [Anaerobranca californiensis]SHK22096.1 HDIG domain-containing protein [Anaerobranca californiensis DSM 14826]